MRKKNIFNHFLHQKSHLPISKWNSFLKKKKSNLCLPLEALFGFAKKNWFYTMILALYQAYSKINFRWLFKLIFFLNNFKVLKSMKLSKKVRKHIRAELSRFTTVFLKIAIFDKLPFVIVAILLFCNFFLGSQISEMTIFN